MGASPGGGGNAAARGGEPRRRERQHGGGRSFDPEVTQHLRMNSAADPIAGVNMVKHTVLAAKIPAITRPVSVDSRTSWSERAGSLTKEPCSNDAQG
jgi:hypothetical protein